MKMSRISEGFFFHFSSRPLKDLATLARYSHEILRGLIYLNARGIVHRNLSLKNILLDETVRARPPTQKIENDSAMTFPFLSHGSPHRDGLRCRTMASIS